MDTANAKETTVYLFNRSTANGAMYLGLVEVHNAPSANAAHDAAMVSFPRCYIDAAGFTLHTTDDGVRQDGDKALDYRTGLYYDARDGIPA